MVGGPAQCMAHDDGHAAGAADISDAHLTAAAAENEIVHCVTWARMRGDGGGVPGEELVHFSYIANPEQFSIEQLKRLP